jgi:hypothetical protein
MLLMPAGELWSSINRKQTFVSEHTIIVKLMGGMGNQMFQYAFGLYLARKNNSALKFDLHFLLDRTPRANFVFRDYDLDIFMITENERASLAESSHFSGQMGNGFMHDLFARVRRKLRKPEHILDYSSRYIPSFRELTGDLYLEGYFQSPYYFQGIDDLLRREFSFREPVLPESQDLKERIVACNSVCLNVRRADFVQENLSANVQGFVGTDYYSRAVAKMKEQVKDIEIFVFSDDISWCENNLRFDVPTTFVDHSHKGKKFGNYLQLMTLCRHYIIPNSTFAWWAAWLSDAPGKKVIVPQRWYVDPKLDGRDIVPDSWQTV